tara:strand:+ start:2074 stop:2967 length:894 start_codon:yes stop_codon:yes gene_type:complete
MNFKKKYLKANKIAIAFKDLGAANLILNFIKYTEKKNIFYYSSNPAKKLFNNSKLKKYLHKAKTEKELFHKADLYIGGSGFSNFEKKYLTEAKKRKINSFTVLDNFTYYPKRFLYNNKFYLPDGFITFDHEAFKLAKKYFKKKKIFLLKNYYFYDLKKRIKKNDKVKKNILFISEPFKPSHEIESFRFLLKKLTKIKLPTSSKIYVKLHPKDQKQKYKNIINKFSHKLNIIISDKLDSIELLNRCRWIFGITSYLLYMSAKLGKKTFHCKLPGQGNIKLINHKKIKSIYSYKLDKLK